MKTITINHDMKNTDGSDWTAAQFAGFEISIDGKPAVVLPAAWAARSSEGKATFVFDAVALGFTVAEGQHSAVVRAVDKDGDRSDPSAAAVWVEKLVPTAPLAVSVA